jgi:hypothetical protein
VGGAPSSVAVFEDLGEHGLPPTFTRLSLTLGRVSEIQGETCMSLGRGSGRVRRYYDR